MDLTLHGEDARITRHLAGAERELRRRDVKHLPVEVRRVRAYLLDALRDYRLAGRYPRNPDHVDQTPYFIDGDGTRCAMAHLLELVGAGALVQRVAAAANNARVHELAGDPELLRFLAAMGFTVDEAARVQPSYCMMYKKAHCFCPGPYSSETVSAVVRGVVVGMDGGQPQLRIEEVLSGTASVGTQLRVATAASSGTSILARIQASGASEMPAYWIANGESQCSEILVGIQYTEAELISSVMSTDCVASLTAVDPKFGQSACDGSDAGRSEGGVPIVDTGTKVIDTGVAAVDTGAGALDTGVAADAAADTSISSIDSGTVDASSPPPLTPRSDSGGGCSMSSTSDATSLLLVAMATAALLRRRDRARAS